MKTFSQKPANVKREWFVIDATDIPLGRLASFAAELVNGSNKVTFSPHVDEGDYLVITNTDKVRITGKKSLQKIYYRHSGYIGSLKETSAKELLEKDSTEVIRKAVYGMLPKNKLRDAKMARLKIYSGNEHDNSAQSPKEVTIPSLSAVKQPKKALKKEEVKTEEEAKV